MAAKKSARLAFVLRFLAEAERGSLDGAVEAAMFLFGWRHDEKLDAHLMTHDACVAVLSALASHAEKEPLNQLAKICLDEDAALRHIALMRTDGTLDPEIGATS